MKYIRKTTRKFFEDVPEFREGYVFEGTAFPENGVIEEDMTESFRIHLLSSCEEFSPVSEA